MKKKILKGYIRKNWKQDFEINGITGRILYPETYKTEKKYEAYGSILYTLQKVKITIEEVE